MSTSSPRHVIGVPRHSLFFFAVLPLSYIVCYCEHKPKNKQKGRPGNEATLIVACRVLRAIRTRASKAGGSVVQCQYHSCNNFGANSSKVIDSRALSHCTSALS